MSACFIFTYFTLNLYITGLIFSLFLQKNTPQAALKKSDESEAECPADFLQWTHWSMKKAVGAENDAIGDLLKQPWIKNRIHPCPD